MMVTASGGSAPPFSSYTTPYIVTNASGNPGDVSIYLPGNSSEMGAVFNVKSVNAPAGGMSTSSYVFGSYNPSDPNNTAGLNAARGAYVNPSNFAGRAASVFDSGANLPVSTARRRDCRLQQPAYSDGRERRRQHLVVPQFHLLHDRHALPMRYPVWIMERRQRRQQQRSTHVRRSGPLVAVGRGQSDDGWEPPDDWYGHLHRPRDRRYRQRDRGSHISRCWRIFSRGRFSSYRNGAITINGLDGTSYTGTAVWVPGTTSFATPNGSPLTGSFQGYLPDGRVGQGLDSDPDQLDAGVRRDGRVDHLERSQQLPRKRHLSRPQTLMRFDAASCLRG